MSRSRAAQVLMLAYGVVFYAVTSFAMASTASPSTDPCPPEVDGRYANAEFGFMIDIPPGFKGRWHSGPCARDSDRRCICMTDFGRVIPLSSPPYEPEHHIEVSAGGGARSLTREVNSRLSSLRRRLKGRALQVTSRRRFKLAGLKAERVLVRYRDDVPDVQQVKDFVLALRGGITYYLDLTTREADYERDRNLFNSVLDSFSLREAER